MLVNFNLWRGFDKAGVLHIPRTVYSHVLHCIGLVLLVIGCLYYFRETNHDVKDLYHFLPSILAFVSGIFISIFNPDHFGWLSQVDPLTGLFLALTAVFSICGLFLFSIGSSKAGELVLQVSAASFSFLGGLEAGMIRQRAKERARRSPRKKQINQIEEGKS